MNPYVGDGTYTYVIDLPTQKNAVGIEVSSVGGSAKLKNKYQPYFMKYWMQIFLAAMPIIQSCFGLQLRRYELYTNV